MTRLLMTWVALLFTFTSSATGLDDIRQALEKSSASQVQEKVYVHTDNQCYFVGDTLWYKAYVVRADNLMPTDMSRLLYVELLSPDGMLVERQTVIVSPNGFTCGQFTLRDSLYSGYYELRAYTRWMLNFNVRHHYYRQDETWWFYNRQMAADYFRVWDGLYSRVFPVYSKPDDPGDYDARRMYQRPKTRLPRKKADDLVVTFYPEGGHLVEGVENRVAFDICDQHGEAVNIKGTVQADGQQPISVATEYMGRGTLNVTPGNKRLKASFRWRDKQWTVNLPKAETRGATFILNGSQLTISACNLPADRQYAVSVLCRGVLKHFQEVVPGTPSDNSTDAAKATLSGKTVVNLPVDQLPTGVCDVTLFDSEGQILADRLFFVNHHEHDDALITTTVARNQTFAPFQRMEIPVQLGGVAQPTTFSLAIRDTYTDEPTYDTDNLMTSMLLSSELRGFIAWPDHYFEADDDVHRRHLDLLMMVQGWRKYKWEELANSSTMLRYQPERTLTVEGTVYKTLGITPVEPDEVASWQDGIGMIGHKNGSQEDYVDPWADEQGTDVADVADDTDAFGIDYGSLSSANDAVGVDHGNLRREVMVEAELYMGDEFAGAVQKTHDRGRFIFEIPPFYGNTYLNLKAYREQDSIKKSMTSRKDVSVYNEEEFPDFYVKRDVFYPVYTHDYGFYEKHQPDVSAEMLIDTLSELSMENDVHQLGNVDVKGRRRGKRAVDWKKPAFVTDAYDLYNDITDRGLSFGKLDMRQFPVQVCKYLFGNMNRPISYNVDARVGGNVYYRNYSPFSSDNEAERAGFFRAHRTGQAVYKELKLKRLKNIRVFTDFEPRTEDSLMTYEQYAPDAIVDLETIPDDGVQITYRDRHILLRGINMATDFYQPDYSNRQPQAPADYRRTLYWNPNAVTDADGHFTAVFYNCGKETRIAMTAAGIAPDGRLLHSR